MANRSDNFNRPGSVTLDGSTPSDGGSAWVEETPGTWKTDVDGTSGRTVAYNVGGPMSAWLETSTPEHEVSADIVTVITNVGVLGRVEDASNYYLFRCLAGPTELYKRVGGTFTKLGDGSSGAASGDRLSLRCDGSTISGFVNGVSVISVSDSSLTSGTKAGIYGGAGFVDDFSSVDVGGGGGPVQGKGQRWYYDAYAGAA